MGASFDKELLTEFTRCLKGAKNPHLIERMDCYLSVQASDRMGAGKVSVAMQVRVIKSSVAEVVEVNTREEGGSKTATSTVELTSWVKEETWQV